MLSVAALLTLLVVQAPNQPKNPGCGVLNAQEVATLVGPGAKTVPVSSSTNGGTCMYQSGDKIVTVLLTKQASAEHATKLWTAKRSIAGGQEIFGWPPAAYQGSAGTVPIVGLVKDATFIEVKVIDAKQKLADLAPKLRAAMKGAASRM